MAANIILTSSFQTVAKELLAKSLLPERASVAFIPTAGDPYAERPWIDADRKALIDLGYHVTDVDIKNHTAAGLAEQLVNHDIIFVAGGNTTYLAQQSHAVGFATIIRDLLKRGKIYIGSSAGSILAGPTVEPFLQGDLTELPEGFVVAEAECLDLVDYVVLPHDHVDAFAAEHDKIIAKYSGALNLVRMTDNEYRVSEMR